MNVKVSALSNEARALSLTQPWASACILGIKRYETRSWSTKFRGTIYIHAAKGWPKAAFDFTSTEIRLGRISGPLSFGALIGTVDIVDVFRTEDIEGSISGLERLYGDYTPGRFAWKLENPKPLMTPIPCKGALGLWRIPEGILIPA